MADETPTASTPSSGYSNKRPMWQWILLYIVIGAIAYGLLYYFVFAKKNNNQTAVTPTEMPQATQEVSPTTAISTSPQLSPSGETMTKQEFTVTGSEFAFAPSTITVKVNTPVTITFKNNGTYPHNLTITDLGIVSKTIQPGSEDTITFTPTKTGSFAFQCTVDSHAEKGMKGTLLVK